MLIEIGSGKSRMVGLPKMAVWNSAGRPANPKKGTIGFNFETRKLEIWDGNSWHASRLNSMPVK